MNAIRTYMRANAGRLLVAAVIICALATGMIDPAMAACGIMLETAPVDIKSLSEATQKAFEKMMSANAEIKAANSELKARVLDLEQKGGRRPSSALGSGRDDDGGDIIGLLEASDGFKALRRGETKTAGIIIPAKALQRKTITSTIVGGSISQPDRDSVIVAPSERRLMVRGLLPAVPTEAGSTEFIRELVYTNNAGPQYDASPGTTEGALKAASDMTLELVNSPVITVAHHFTVSRQALEDSAALGQHIATRGIYGWQLEVDHELLLGDGTAGTLNGLMNNATVFTRGATNQTLPDTIRKACTQLLLSDHVPTGIVLNPADAESLELAKDAQGRYLQVFIVGRDGSESIWRVPVVQSNTMSGGQFLVGDFTMAARIRDRSEARVEVSLDHADYRTRNLALILIEGRLGLEIHRPIALVKGSTAYST